MPATGITKFAVAINTADTINNLAYNTPVVFQNIQELDIKPKQNTDKAYAENRLIDQATLFDSADLTAQWYDLYVQERALILGQNISAEGGTYAALGDTAPYLAALYKSPLTGNQGNRYGVVYKGQFTLPDDTMKGLEGKPDLGQVPKVTGSFQPTNFVIKVTDPNTGLLVEKHPWEYHIDTTQDLDEMWFGNVYIPGVDTTALTATTIPLDAATGVSASGSVVITFNKALNVDTVNGTNIFLMKADGTSIATAVTIDSTNKIITIDPIANLAVGDYVGIVTEGVTSLSGVKLSDKLAINFTV
ncbi:major tail protein [Clostridium akagii]|uniref:major tail protein n=1 Tax=Clostridium akagii TaxID=91623 RepID=UPI00047992C4|nr:major tail protein [Clostridium akagii]